MAEVYRAIMPGAEGFKRTFVIKKILSHLSESGSFVDMFVREARIGALLNHPNIVQVYDFGNVDGHYFLAMEYLRGRDVLAIIRRLRDTKRRFPIPVAAHIAHEVAGCLAYAHALTGPDGRALGIVHRDVSPSNVMCLREGGVKLLDFGIASAVCEIAVDRTEQGTFKGKLAYISPERLRNETVDGRADLYSLGVLLWEMLTCRRLFRGSSEADTFRRVLDMAVPPPSELRPDVSPKLDGIVLRMLERDRDKRYQTGKELADDLEDVLREYDFRSKMVPELLIELFGSGIHSSQVALSCLTPELLSAPSGTDFQAAGTGSVSQTPIVSRRRWLRLSTGVAVLALGVIVVWGAWSGWFSAKSAVPLSGSPRAPATAVAAKSTPPGASAPSAPAATVVASPVAKQALDPEQASPRATRTTADLGMPRPRASKVAAASRRVAKTPARDDDNPIANGRSIDPFAEAVKRGR